MTYTSSILLGIALLLTPAALWFEHAYGNVWQERLLWPTFEEEMDRHTPRHTSGTLLPTHVTGNVTLTPAQNPVVVLDTTYITTTGSVVLEPGTTLLFQEHGRLEVAGKLSARGTEGQPIRISSNEAHLENRTWSGIMFKDRGEGMFEHAILTYGSPAITCLKGSIVTVRNSTVELGSAGVYTESETCTVENSRINGPVYGVIAVGVDPQLKNNVITARRKEVEIFNDRDEPRGARDE